MPAAARTAPDFRCGPRQRLGRGKASVQVGPQVYTLAVYLKHKRVVSLRAAKVRLWGGEADATSDNAVSKVGQRLNEKLLELGATARVSICDGRVELK